MRDKSLTMTIDHKIKPLKHSHAQEDMGSYNHRVCVRLTAHHLDGKDFRHINFLDLIIDISHHGTAKPQKP